MKVRSAWPSAFLVVFLGCGSGSIGAPDNGGPGNGTGGSSSGDVGAGGSGNGGSAGSSAVVAGTPVDGGVLIDGSFVAYSATPPPSEGAVVGEVITKLTAVEYANTVNDLLGITPIQQTVPLSADSTAGGFSIGGASTDDTAQAYHDAAIVIATVATSATGMPNLLKAANCTAPAANAGSAGAACAAAFINEFAPLAFRHGPVDAATIAGLNGVYNAVAVTDAAGFSGGMAAVLEEILQSPYFLYHLETEQQALGMYNTPIPVTGYSMANRLSYLLWSSMPDTALFAAAAGNELSTAAQVSAQATRMVQDPKAKIGLRNFYQQWLTALTLPSGKVGNSTQILPNGSLSATSLFGTTNGLSLATEFSPALQQAIVESFDMQAEAALWAPTGAMKTLLTGDTVYANSLLAPILGVTVAAGTTALTPVTVDTTKRSGILSHPLLMATYATTSTSHPIKRGRFVWDQIVCQPLPNPPAGVPAFIPPTAGMSLRQDYELLTSTGPYAGKTSAGQAATGIPCPQCHTRIDPVGFLYESFDTVGALRTIDDYGQPVDMTNNTIAGFTGSEAYLNVLMNSSTQLATALANSDLPDACITQNFYKFMARRNDAVADFPVEAWLDQTFVATGENLSAVLVGTTQTDVFLQRMNTQ
jgi:Protein of unknown function (DUF1592)/Protein of unknown function (DUF1588)/Protein of unknown function (DUF1595)/Protein of unknown function (DUF1587)